jgi:hypothetical protein
MKLLRWVGVVADTVSETLPLRVEGGSVGLVARAQARDDTHMISVELIGPLGQVLSCWGCDDAPAVGEVEAGSGSVQMPSTDRP